MLEIYAIRLLLDSDWAILYRMHQNRSALMKRFLQIVAPQNPRARHSLVTLHGTIEFTKLLSLRRAYKVWQSYKQNPESEGPW